jgi:hypothetical protein
MGIQSPATVILLVALAVVATVATLALWNRVPGRRWTRAGVRLVALLVCQCLAVLSVAVVVNDHYRLYASWGELVGQSNVHAVSPTLAQPEIDRRYERQLRRAFARREGLVIHWSIPGTSSGVPNLPALAYLPAAYGDPSAPDKRFPVVELLDGVPGTPQSWFSGLHLRSLLDTAMRNGRTAPFIAILPTQNVRAPHDTECLDVVGGPAVDTYLTTDVHRAVLSNFRAEDGPASWAVAGISTGGYCAMNLAMQHPYLFGAAASMSGYARPDIGTSPDNLLHDDPILTEHNTPLWEEAHWGCAPLSILAAASRQDGPSFRDTEAVIAAARAPLRITPLLVGHGGHTVNLWNALAPFVFAWLSAHVAPALTPVGVHTDYGAGAELDALPGTTSACATAYSRHRR